MRNEKVKRLVQLGLLTAISIVLVYLVRFPIFPSAAYLEYDMADVPILIGTFLFGPWWGLLLTFTVSLLQWLLVSPASGWVGFLMHFCATGSSALVAGYIYQRNRTIRGAIAGLLISAIVHVLMMIPLNLIFTVHFNGAPREVVIAMPPTVIIPFNLIKVGLNGLFTFLLYNRVGKLLRFEKTEPCKQN
ncbi:MAG: ECF transporter S component [Eubacteriales bacterium]|nr:ECF transporter S component [Eubacteriales bacterium]